MNPLRCVWFVLASLAPSTLRLDCGKLIISAAQNTVSYWGMVTLHFTRNMPILSQPLDIDMHTDTDTDT